MKKPTSKIAVLGFSFLKSEKILSIERIRNVKAIEAGESNKLSLKKEVKSMNNAPAM